MVNPRKPINNQAPTGYATNMRERIKVVELTQEQFRQWCNFWKVRALCVIICGAFAGHVLSVPAYSASHNDKKVEEIGQ